MPYKLEKAKIIFIIKFFSRFTLIKHWIGLGRLMKFNRKTLGLVEEWLSEDMYNKSYWNYGIPKHPKNVTIVEKKFTYTDAMLYLTRFLNGKINYLEIGVSCGKNFLQNCNYLQNSMLAGIDIEEINPVLEQFFDSRQQIKQWDSTFTDFHGILRQKKSSLTQYKYTSNHNTIFYSSGNKFDEQTWEVLAGKKFNFIFSDSCHKRESLISEINMIQKYELLNESNFLIVYDDLGGELKNVFWEIAEKLSRMYNIERKYIQVLDAYGSYGYERSPHRVGFILKK